MKQKKELIDYLATAALIMILTFQVWHTAGLYLTYSKLEDNQQIFAAYFLGFTLELMVYIFVNKGYETAGAWFSICLFFVGIFFNDNWEGSEVSIQYDPFQINRIYFPLVFLSSTLLQFMSSLSIWYLTDIHVKRRMERDLIKRLAELSKEEEAVNNRIAEKSIQYTELQKSIQVISTEIKTASTTKAELENLVTELKEEVTEYRIEVKSLKKQKAGYSRRKKVNL